MKPLSLEERWRLSPIIAGVADSVLRRSKRLSDYDCSDVSRLLKALNHEESDRLPHIEL